MFDRIAHSVVRREGRRADETTSTALVATVDHLVYATPDLQVGVERVERIMGVRASPGGQHPGAVPETPCCRSVQERIGDYRSRSGSADSRATASIRLDSLKEPRLVTWAAKGKDLEQLASTAHVGA